MTASADLFGVEEGRALRVAAAIEMVHCYSLIYDDLPAMDNDDMRRGMPTCHIKFDEATAILAGDALLTRAFGVLSEPATHGDAKVRSDLVCELARAAGQEGMVGGQMLDLLAQHEQLAVAEVTRLQRMKTGALIGDDRIIGHEIGVAIKAVTLVIYHYELKVSNQVYYQKGDQEHTGKGHDDLLTNAGGDHFTEPADAGNCTICGFCRHI